ncbi:hypothetical protein AGLY_011270 [Aphis glycines]|uniref:Uncharacterized protein n=1 Tax=Aphis glycines TaxID=307491 RepID=A0A6G0TDK3_APHGL|nr:hypothetical protein AGLY_011270 [Aphis glycines]
MTYTRTRRLHLTVVWYKDTVIQLRLHIISCILSIFFSYFIFSRRTGWRARSDSGSAETAAVPPTQGASLPLLLIHLLHSEPSSAGLVGLLPPVHRQIHNFNYNYRLFYYFHPRRWMCGLPKPSRTLKSGPPRLQQLIVILSVILNPSLLITRFYVCYRGRPSAQFMNRSATIAPRLSRAPCTARLCDRDVSHLRSTSLVVATSSVIRFSGRQRRDRRHRSASSRWKRT